MFGFDKAPAEAEAVTTSLDRRQNSENWKHWANITETQSDGERYTVTVWWHL